MSIGDYDRLLENLKLYLEDEATPTPIIFG